MGCYIHNSQKKQIKPEQASVAGGCSDDDLRVKTQELAKAIADYKQGSKSANSLYSQHKPKQPKSTPKAKAAPLAIENQQ